MSRTIALNVDAGESFGAWSMGDAGAMFDLVTTMSKFLCLGASIWPMALDI